MTEFALGCFLILGVEEVSKNMISHCEQIDPHVKPSHVLAVFIWSIPFTLFNVLSWNATRLYLPR